MKCVAWTEVVDWEFVEKWAWRPSSIVRGAECAGSGEYAIL